MFWWGRKRTDSCGTDVSKDGDEQIDVASPPRTEEKISGISADGRRSPFADVMGESPKSPSVAHSERKKVGKSMWTHLRQSPTSQVEQDAIELDDMAIRAPKRLLPTDKDSKIVIWKEKPRFRFLLEVMNPEMIEAESLPNVKQGHLDDSRDEYGFEVEVRYTPLLSYYTDQIQKSSELRTRMWKRALENAGYDISKLQSSGSIHTLIPLGIPPELRSQIWSILSGMEEYRNSYSISYHEIGAVATVSPTSYAEQIETDLRRTFPAHPLLHSAEILSSLRRILCTYASIRPDVGYCQSMNFVAASLLMFMTEEDSFWCLLHITDNIATPEWYTSNLLGVNIEAAILEHLVKWKLPHLFEHLQSLGFMIGQMCFKWFLCFFVTVVPFETAMRIWDGLFMYGRDSMLRVSLSLFRMMSDEMLQAVSLGQVMVLFQEEPKKLFHPELLFKFSYDDRWFGDVNGARMKELRSFYSNHFRQQILAWEISVQQGKPE